MSILSMPACCRKSDYSAPLHGDYTLQLYESIDAVEDAWALVSDSHDIFYSASFLRCIERVPPSDITPYYCLVSKKEVPVGIVYLQSTFVRLSNNLKVKPATSVTGTFSPLRWARKKLIDRINLHTVICGNLLLTGKYGFYFTPGMSKDDEFRLVGEAMNRLQIYLEKKGVTPGLVLVKDFFEREAPVSEPTSFGFTRFSVQPKMLLRLQPEWNTMEDYTADLKSKYRVRMRKALQKGSQLQKRLLDTDEIALYRKEIHALYKHVAGQAEFNAFELHERYFEELKAALGDLLTFTSYWKDDRMVAFFTSIRNYDVLDAHFLGYDPDENHECQIYLNMLYDLIREGIDKRMEVVDMSRTAIEIKSTVGAVPHNMVLYLKHSQPLLNYATSTILGMVKPSAEFIIRDPFRGANDT